MSAQLRRMKSWLRSSISQVRLNHALMLAVHREQLEALDMDAGVEVFAAQSVQRTNMFGRW